MERTVGIEGRACSMCEAHINEAVRNAFRVKKVTSPHTKKQTEILAEMDIPEQSGLCDPTFAVSFEFCGRCHSLCGAWINADHHKKGGSGCLSV